MLKQTPKPIARIRSLKSSEDILTPERPPERRFDRIPKDWHYTENVQRYFPPARRRPSQSRLDHGKSETPRAGAELIALSEFKPTCPGELQPDIARPLRETLEDTVRQNYNASLMEGKYLKTGKLPLW